MSKYDVKWLREVVYYICVILLVFVIPCVVVLIFSDNTHPFIMDVVSWISLVLSFFAVMLAVINYLSIIRGSKNE